MDPNTDAPRQYLTFDAICAADDVRELDVHVPEWGGYIRIKTLSFAAYKQSLAASQVMRPDGTTGADEDTLYQRLLADGSVAPVLTYEQAQALWSRSTPSIKRLVAAINTLNNFSAASTEAEADAEADATFRPEPGPDVSV